MHDQTGTEIDRQSQRHAHRLDRRLVGLISAVLLTAAVAFPLGVVASHQFVDVLDSNTFHDDIDAIGDAGVTTGCAPDRYCPKDFVTREQMAAFLNRLGALGPGKTPVVNATKLDGKDSSQFLRSDVANTGRDTCSGTMMIPAFSTYDTGSQGGRRFSANGAVLVCGPRLPDGATITSFSGRIYDNSAVEKGTCALHRYLKAEMISATVLASFGSSEVYEGGVFFGNVTTIVEPLVDNEVYAYVVRCSTTGGGGAVAILHLDVVYSVSGLGLS